MANLGESGSKKREWKKFLLPVSFLLPALPASCFDDADSPFKPKGIPVAFLLQIVKLRTVV
jgi:hypothetical protein